VITRDTYLRLWSGVRTNGSQVKSKLESFNGFLNLVLKNLEFKVVLNSQNLGGELAVELDRFWNLLVGWI